MVRGAPPGEPTPEGRELTQFKAWLDREHPGYGCDEGPAPFRNATVAAAYGGRRFYYVLTHARGVRPPFANALSLVAHVDEHGAVHPLRQDVPGTFQAGLLVVTSRREARRAAAAVLILALGDPGGRRWSIDEERITVAHARKGWTCTYLHGDSYHASDVIFDRRGRLVAIHCNPPPVP